jgi:hypothetical protein
VDLLLALPALTPAAGVPRVRARSLAAKGELFLPGHFVLRLEYALLFAGLVAGTSAD